ncbi:hypothetical protein GCM10027176_36270 [Actinoallomurus bryophytorum]|uniref:Uncharacterized protein n=2 Tax=Actinoallomurus bryophytorum TaxID=1490222 RepID=A0A543CIN7_9ACTN|nr:hypothetical protein FB559_2514 [Actinoallomurus bryophytorum]
MKSDQARLAWRDVLDRAKRGESTVVIHYNRTIARIIPETDDIVVIRTKDANQAERLRNLVREHRSIGIPFPNNTHPDWTVVDGQREPVNVHEVPSVGVELA